MLRHDLGDGRANGGETIEEGGRLWWRRSVGEIAQHPDKSFEAAVHREDLPYPRGRRGEVYEMCERVEERERGVGVQGWVVGHPWSEKTAENSNKKADKPLRSYN